MSLRKMFRSVLTALSLPFAVILYFNIENLAARLGWANLLADAIAPEGGDSPVFSFIQHPLVVLTAVFGLGLALGFWADFLLSKRERGAAPEEKAILDREALADEAFRVGQAICVLSGQATARNRMAWEADTQFKRDGDVIFSRERSVREEAITLEKYAEAFAADACRIIDQASRMLNLDGRASGVNGYVHSAHEIGDVGRFLISIANELRYPGNPILPDLQTAQRITAANQQRLAQSGTEAETSQ